MARVVDDEMRAYYERRAPEYDDWWLGGGRFAELDRPGWHDEVEQLIGVARRRCRRPGCWTWPAAPAS